jgi:hypothetical protein
MMTSSSRGAQYFGGGTPWLLQLRSTEPHPVFFYIECVCNAWFSVELIVRLAVAPSRLTFVLTPVNIIELIASASFYLDFLMTYLKRDSDVLEFFRYSMFEFRHLMDVENFISFPRNSTNRMAVD